MRQKGRRETLKQPRYGETVEKRQMRESTNNAGIGKWYLGRSEAFNCYTLSGRIKSRDIYLYVPNSSRRGFIVCLDWMRYYNSPGWQ